jgi:hypothetical protein
MQNLADLKAKIAAAEEQEAPMEEALKKDEKMLVEIQHLHE